jgi:predicted metal-binding protein
VFSARFRPQKACRRTKGIDSPLITVHGAGKELKMVQDRFMARALQELSTSTPSSDPISPAESAHIFVCRNCPHPERHHGRGAPEGAGLEIARRVEAAAASAGVAVILRRVECLSGCRHPCNVRITSPGRAGYAFRLLEPADAAAVVEFARDYLATADGCIAKTDMANALAQGLVAMSPPRPSSTLG